MKDLKKITVFYSWASDHPTKLNQSFIEEALKKAMQSILLDDEAEIRPFIDRDTRGVPGSPPIADTILKKIDKSDIFVADVSIVTPSDAERPMSNPNVMLELGYAIKCLGLNKIILVMNTAFGAIKDLPFDLLSLRIANYELSETEYSDTTLKTFPGNSKQLTHKQFERKNLKANLEWNVRAIAEDIELEDIAAAAEKADEPTNFEKLHTALEEDAKPLKVMRIIREAATETIERINKIEWFNVSRNLESRELADLMVKCDQELTELINLAAFGIANGESQYSVVWAEILTKLAAEVAPERRIDDYRFYPALVYLYATGIIAVNFGNYYNLAALFNKAKTRSITHRDLPDRPGYNLVPYRVIPEDEAKKLNGVGGSAYPITRHFWMMLQPKLKGLIRDEKDFDEAFVRFEYLFALSSAEVMRTSHGGGGVPVGRYFEENYLIKLRGRAPHIMIETNKEISKYGKDWEPYKEKVFELYWDELIQLKVEVDGNIHSVLKKKFPDLEIRTLGEI